MTQSNAEHCFSLTANGTEASVRETLALVRARMQAWGMSDDLCGNIEIALAEAMNNIVEHAYAETSGPVEISAEMNTQHLLIDLKDQGQPLPGLSLPKGTLPDHQVALEDLPEGGFGWFLIHNLTERLLYRRTGKVNCLTMVFALPPSVGQE